MELCAALGLMGAVAALACSGQTVPGPASGVTNLRVTSQVILPGVTRLGINLGEQNYYDSGQMLKNLLKRNPGFEGMTNRSILHCKQVGADLCIDRRPGLLWPAGFWDGGHFEVLDGVAVGRQGTVFESGPQSGGGQSLSLDGKGRPIAQGDWIAVSKEFPGDPVAGWWPKVEGGARFEAERKDLPPGLPGHQALRIEAAGRGESAELKSYFDSTEGMTFLRLRGWFRLSFRAKALAGFRMLHVRVLRIAPGARPFLDQDVFLKPAWGEFQLDFAAGENASPTGPVEVSFTAAGGSLLMDDVDLELTGGDPANHTVFRDEVVKTLKELHPGVLRMMESHCGLGSSIDNLLAPAAARQRAGFLGWSNTMEDIPVGIPEFLELCQEVGAEPWIVVPTAMSKAEARTLAEYLTGAPSTSGGGLRTAAGHPAPWIESFRTIHIELGNETWNGIYLGESMDSAAAYGRRANVVFAALRAAAGAEAGRLDLAVGAQAAAPGRNGEILAAAPLANTLAIAPYLMHSVTGWATDDELYGPLMAEAEQMSRDGVVAASAASAGGRQLAVYEVNLHTTEGTATQAVLDRLTPSAAAGVAVAGHMLRMMREHGIRDQMLFSLPQYQFKRPDGTFVRLWGSVVDMGPTGRKRPQLLAEGLVNRVVRGNMVRVEVTGDNPTHDQPAGNDGVRLSGDHELDAYAFQEGKWHGLAIFNYGLHHSRLVRLEAPGLGPSSKPNLWRLKSSGPQAGNEAETQVTVEPEKFVGRELSLAPCSIAVLEWSE